jgi:alginate O-acetyltransferase complex protein AlgJ
MNFTKIKNRFLIIAFLLILALPTLDSLFHFAPVKYLYSKRLPVAKPLFPSSYEGLKSYPQNFEKFFNDNYGFRKTLISLNNQITDKVFDESPDARAVVGKDGWFYFDNHNSLLDAVGKAEISDEMVARGVESFYHNWQMMRAKNIDYALVIAADKATIYPEFLPEYMTYQGPHRIDKFLDALKKKYPDFPVIDLRPILIKAKANEILYHKTDTHWNMRGTHYGYLEIAKKLHIKPHLRADFFDDESTQIRGDISVIMNVYRTNTNFNLKEKFKTQSHKVAPPWESLNKFYKPNLFLNDDKTLPIIFAYTDSYFSKLSVLLLEHFSQGIYVYEFPCDLNYEIIKNFHPNVVIQEFWEGHLEVVLSQCKN